MSFTRTSGSFTRGADSFTRGSDSFTRGGVGGDSFTRGGDSFTRGGGGGGLPTPFLQASPADPYRPPPAAGATAWLQVGVPIVSAGSLPS